MEKARAGSGAARTTALVVLVAVGLFVMTGLLSPAAQARPKSVCCFRVTVEVAGRAESEYTKVDQTDYQGRYSYEWGATAYGIAHLQSTALLTDRGVAAGYITELNGVKDSEGRLVTGNDPGCSEVVNSYQATLKKTRHGYPYLGSLGGFDLGNPFGAWELKCGSLASETLGDLQRGNGHWAVPRQFFFGAVRGLSARKLAKGHSQKVTCFEHSRPAAQPTRHSQGFSAVSINVVPFHADELRRQQHRLAGFVGQHVHVLSNLGRPIDNLQQDFLAGRPVPGNGCHKG